MSENEDDNSVDSNGNIRDLIADSDVPKKRYVIRTDYRRSKRPRPPPTPTTEEYSSEETPITEESEPEPPKSSRIFLSFGGFPKNNMISKKYNIKREPKNVQRFYSLITEPDEETVIDSQITYFKNLDKREQDK